MQIDGVPTARRSAALGVAAFGVVGGLFGQGGLFVVWSRSVPRRVAPSGKRHRSRHKHFCGANQQLCVNASASRTTLLSSGRLMSPEKCCCPRRCHAAPSAPSASAGFRANWHRLFDPGPLLVHRVGNRQPDQLASTSLPGCPTGAARCPVVHLLDASKSVESVG